jgi:ATP-dependent Clp protease ATP-binding subunit ClpC
VGKTELARALAGLLFGHSPDEAEAAVARRADARLVRLDMSEYAGPDAADRLLGPPHGEPSLLIRRLRQQPFAVVLLDEIEKAGPEAFDVLLGALDEGRLTDRFGRMTTFRSAVIVMTSNLGAGRGDAFGFGGAPAAVYADAAREFFRPEFFNRLDAVVTFGPLAPETVEAIARKELGEIAGREGFRRAGLWLRWSDALVAHLAKTGFDARRGARPLQRVLEREVVAPLARFLLERPGLRDAEVVVDHAPDSGVRVSA